MQVVLNLLTRFGRAPTSSQKEEIKGPIALESCLGIDSDHPLGSGGLDPLQPGDNEDSSRDRNNKRVRCKNTPPRCKVSKFKMLNDLGTLRVYFIGFTNSNDYVDTPYQDIDGLHIPDEIFKLAESRYWRNGIKARGIPTFGDPKTIY